MNFSTEVKGELIEKPIRHDEEKRALLSAFIRTAGVIYSKSGKVGFEITTDRKELAEFIKNVAGDLYGSTPVEPTAKPSKNGRTAVVFLDETSLFVLEDLGIVKIDEDGVAVNLNVDWSTVESDQCRTAYIKGAFLGSGSVTIPGGSGSTTGYHLEFVFTNYQTATDFCEILSEAYFMPKLIERKGDYVVYLKTMDEISDLLALIGANKAVLKLSALSVERDMNNMENRRLNCEMSNMTKQIDASVKQIRAVSKIDASIGLSSLPESLRSVAEARTKYKSDTLKELADKLKITKSCLNHRLRKLVEIANEL
ncbi:MAG: DNA-binding protein WhiA [Clostridia bacterium]|nr:DNA-binding protein WhiA [Clostridia bacterium]